MARNDRQPLGAQSGPCRQQGHRDLSPTTTRNSANKQINLEKDPELQKGMQSGQHLHFNFVKPQAEDQDQLLLEF